MDATRRQFVNLLGAGAVFAAQPATPAPQSVRDEFGFADDRIPLNAANLCPSPRRVSAEVIRYTHMIDVDPSFQNRDQFTKHLETSRAAVARQLGIETDEVALVRNTSEANNIINAGINLSAGDEIVIWDQNQQTNNVAWAVRAERYRVVVRTVTVPAQPKSIDDLFAPFEEAITPRTRVLTVRC